MENNPLAYRSWPNIKITRTSIPVTFLLGRYLLVEAWAYFSLLTDPISPGGIAEPELIARILKGERNLFHDLVRPYERPVYVTAYAILRNYADAEEAAQETMIKALTRLDQLHAPEKFKAWLLRIAVNEARLKRRNNHAQKYDSLERDGPENEEHFMPREFADWRSLPCENSRHRNSASVLKSWKEGRCDTRS